MKRFLLYFFVVFLSFGIFNSYAGDTTKAKIMHMEELPEDTASVNIKNTDEVAGETSEGIKHSFELPSNYIGVSASTFSSIGISYHHLFGKRESSGLKITFFVYPDKYHSDKNWTFLGGELQFSLVKSNTARFYFLLGVSYIGPSNGGTSMVWFGPGFGFEFILFKSLALNVDGGITLIPTKKHLYSGSYNSQYTYEINFYPGAGLGLSYAF